MSNRDASVVIPNWNGAEYLPRCIGSLMRALEKVPGDHEIVVVDDGSTDESVGLLRQRFPSVRVIQQGQNRGFSATCNEGVRQVRNDIVVLLNMDTYVDEDFLQPLVGHFAGNEGLFGVGCKQVEWDETTLLMGRMFARFERGLIDVVHEMSDSLDSPCETGLISAGACAVDRSRFLAIGGLSQLARRNDVDLFYRAKKRGWQLLYDPRSVVYHKGMVAAQKRWNGRALGVEIHKDRILITWRNLTDKDLLLKHLLWLPFMPLRWGVRTSMSAIWQALGALPDVVRFRLAERSGIRLSDGVLLRAGRRSAR